MSQDKIKFTVLASYNLSGGMPKGDFYAKSKTELYDNLRKQWYLADLNYERDEAFLEAEIEIGEEIRSVYVGNFLIDQKGNVICTHQNIRDIDERQDSWKSIGFPMDSYEDGQELFDDQIEFLFNASSPSRLIGPWLVHCAKFIQTKYSDEIAKENFSTYRFSNSEYVGNQLLASLLYFSEKFEKSQQMLQWISSEIASEFLFSYEAFSPASDFLIGCAEDMVDQLSNASEIQDYLSSIVRDQSYELIPDLNR